MLNHSITDHKENFRNHPTWRQINPRKSQIGLISKQILDKINRKILEATKINQWKNSNVVIEWLNNIETRNNSTFITFDVDLFDVTMGSYDGAETCELVGTYIPSAINNMIIGLYRDDGFI